MNSQQTLRIEGAQEMNLLGLMLGGILERNLATPKGAALADKLSGRLGVTAGKMKVTMSFGEEGITLHRGHLDGLKASVKGSLDGLLQVSLGRGPVKSFLAGEVSFGGNPFFVLKVLPLMRTDNGRSGDDS